MQSLRKRGEMLFSVRNIFGDARTHGLEELGDAPFDARRAKRRVSALLAVAWLVGMMPFYAWKLQWLDGAVRDGFGLAALAIICVSAIYVFSLLHYGAGVKRMLALGFLFLVAVQAGDTFGAWAMPDAFISPPNRPLIDRPLRQTALVTGGFLLLGGLYFALIEGENLLRRMQRERLRALESTGHLLASESEKEHLEKLLEKRGGLEALGRVAGGIAHDFNNLLTAIMGHTELAGSRAQLDEKTTRHLSLAMQAGYRARDLIQQILTFTRGGAAVRMPIHPYLVAREVATLFETSLDKNIRLLQYIDRQSGLAMANPIELHKVVLNLCTNARYAMKDIGGTLTLRVEDRRIEESADTFSGRIAPGPYVCIEVGDTGMGIPPGMEPNIFEPFFTTKPVNEGTGMGLAIVHGIVNEYGGGILLDNKPGEGAAFQVYLPRIAGAPPK